MFVFSFLCSYYPTTLHIFIFPFVSFSIINLDRISIIVVQLYVIQFYYTNKDPWKQKQFLYLEFEYSTKLSFERYNHCERQGYWHLVSQDQNYESAILPIHKKNILFLKYASETLLLPTKTPGSSNWIKLKTI